MTAEGPNIAEMFNRGQLGGGGGGTGGGRGGASDKDEVNSKDILETSTNNAGHAVGNLTKSLGMNLSNLGEVSVFTGLETQQGFLDKPMLQTPLIPNAQGGMLAKLLYDIFVKNGEIKDHTQIASTGSGGAGGEGMPAGENGVPSHFNPSEHLPVSGERFPVSEMSMASLGDMPPPTVGTGQSQSAQMAV